MGLYGSTPKAPDPGETASAQFNYDMGSTQASGIVNNPNTSDPYGKTNYNLKGYETVYLPDGKSVKVPRYSQDTTLTKTGQKLLNQQQSLAGDAFKTADKALGQKSVPGLPDWTTGYNVGNLRNDYSVNTGSSTYNTPETLQNINMRGDANTQSFSPLLKNFQGLETSYAPEDGFSEDRKRVEQALMSRGSTLLNETRDAEVARLAAMGLAPGGENYGRVADQFGRQANDLAMQSVLAGGQEQSRLLGEARTSAGFGNDATLQDLGARAGLITSENQRRQAGLETANQANQSEFAMRTALTQMENARLSGDMQAYNAALEAFNNAQVAQTALNSQEAGFNNQIRGAMVGENEALKDSSVNRLIGILSGAQIQNPTIPNYFSQGVNSPDYSGLVQSNYAQQVAARNAELGAISGIIGGGADILSGSRWVT